MGTSIAAAQDRLEQNCAEALSRFFPFSKPVHLPVQVSALRGSSVNLREATVVEFATAEHAIFLSSLPLEFADRVRLERGRKGFAAEAKVVAVQYFEGRKAVAVKFTQGPCTWVMEP